MILRKYLTDIELEVFQRWGVPVRYIRGKQKSRILKRDGNKCVVCGATKGLTMAHLIPYRKGILTGKFTPEYLNRDENIVTACRKVCNNKVEKSVE